jgi:FKBP-type peptidyl-prolyl cis-trans isomerase SlpA
MNTVKEKNTVKVHYTGKLSNGEIFDSSKDKDPLEFTLGQGMLIPGFENGVIGMTINESKTISIPCAEGYGDRNPELIQEVPLEQLPPDLNPEVGMQLASRMPDGSEFPVVIAEVKDTSILIDANHPLAGQDLVFDITVVEISE